MELKTLLELVDQYRYSPIILAIVLGGYFTVRYKEYIKTFINKKILSSVFNNKKEHVSLMEDIREISKSVSKLAESVDELKDSISKVRDDQKELNHRFTVAVANETRMETKLLEAISHINYNNDFEFNTEFKSVLVDLSEVISKLHSQLRSEGVDKIDFNIQQAAIARLKLTFQKHGFKDECDLAEITSFADNILTKFNATKTKHSNKDLINNMYLSFVTNAYKILTKNV